MKAISVYISEKEHEAAKIKAKDADFTLSQLVRKLLREFDPATDEA